MAQAVCTLTVPLNFKDMRLKDFEIDTQKKADSAAYYVNGTFEIYFDGFTLIKENCTIEQGKEICNKLSIEWEWGDDQPNNRSTGCFGNEVLN